MDFFKPKFNAIRRPELFGFWVIFSTTSSAWGFGAASPKMDVEIRGPASEPSHCAMGYHEMALRMALAQAGKKIGQFADETLQSRGQNLIFKIPELPRNQIIGGFFRPVTKLTPLEQLRFKRMRSLYRSLNARVVSGAYRTLTLGRQIREPFVFSPISQISESAQYANRALFSRLMGKEIQFSPHLVTVLGLSAADFGYSFSTGEAGLQERAFTAFMDLIFYFPEKWGEANRQVLQKEYLLSLLQRDIRFYSLKKYFEKNPQIEGDKKIDAIQNNLSIHQILLESLSQFTTETNPENQRQLFFSLLDPRVYEGDFTNTSLDEIFSEMSPEKRKAMGLIFREEFKMLSLYFNQHGSVLTKGTQDLIPLTANEFVKPNEDQFEKAIQWKIFRLDALNTLQSLVYHDVEAQMRAEMTDESLAFFEEVKAELLKDSFVQRVLTDLQSGKYKPEFVSFGLGYYLDKKYSLLSFLELGYGLRNKQNPSNHLTPKDFEAPTLKIISDMR